MGYDCTMHVIDEDRIRERFVARLLRPKVGKDAFDQRPDAKELWATVCKLLKSGSAHEAAHAIGQLAVLFCAAELPYHSERGFCLSLWPNFPAAKNAPIPDGCVGNPEELFEALIAKHPQLSGHFPREIESNFSTGHYVPREQVPALLKWARKQDAECELKFDGMFRGLILVLEQAMERKLGYWEGTDLPLDLQTIRPEALTKGVEQWMFPEEGFAHARGLIDQTVFISHGPGEDCWTMAVDISTWPPRYETAPEFTLAVARSAQGKLLTVSADRIDNVRYLARVREGSLSAVPRIVPLAKPGSPNGLTTGGFVGENVVGFAWYDKKRRLPLVPMIEQNGKLVDTRGVDPITKKEEDWSRDVDNEGCTVRLASGVELILWHGAGYTVRDAVTLERVVPDVGRISGRKGVVIPWGEDGFIYEGQAPPERDPLGGREIKLGRPGTAPVPAALAIHNAMEFTSGPDRSLIVKQGDNKRRSLGAIWFPNDDAFIPIERKVFADEDPHDINHLYYSRATGLLIACTDCRFWATPIAPLLTERRVNATSGRLIKDK